ncbi:hypothetical protein DVT68_13010 [Dyella solisilvae]|uniref:Oligosaccharide repeat unit polymerase n=1 Tax=Dyella solisilvae TaxID=1920168 RepID=A0A370K5T0_9GAMM|nr:oligosaccharide repeat unit polymerase [Dyella solisilvae]RDI98003.1 hypothetical protein DVT68_13010 [Dyella solisilvae]
MRRLLRLPSAYLSLPMLVTCVLTLLAYDLPAGYLEGIWLLLGTALAIMMFDLVAGLRLPAFDAFRVRDYVGTREAFVALAFAGIIILFCILDLTLFPIPLIDAPASYAQMEGGRAHVRHISDMCWVLPPIGLLCTRNKALRVLLVAIGLVFPVLVIDRNRIFAALFATALVIVFRRDATRPLPWKIVGVLAIGGAVVFSVLGILRSGTLETVALPFSDAYRAMPVGVQWLLLYASAGPYNFASMLAKHYANPSFLINQLVPMAGSIATAGTDIPLDAPNINVGSEFMPFLLAFGPYGAILSVLVLYAMQRWSVRRLYPRVSLFSLLIFLRMSYVCLMSPFAPQAFTWTNAGFIAICLVLQAVAALLPSRLASTGDPLAAARPPTS